MDNKLKVDTREDGSDSNDLQQQLPPFFANIQLTTGRAFIDHVGIVLSIYMLSFNYMIVCALFELKRIQECFIIVFFYI